MCLFNAGCSVETVRLHQPCRGKPVKRLVGIYLRGMAMGAADVVPGVSGGTLALITGIYRELIDSLAGISPRLLMVWRDQGFAAFWRAGNFAFLTVLLAGILSSIVLLANLLVWLIDHYPVPVWAFFSGLIAASIWLVLKPLERLNAVTWSMLVLGVLLAGWITTRPGLEAFGHTPLVFFLSGAVAICAMILPGISGSFILLLLGMYLPVLEAVRDTQLALLGAFVAGCALGLLSFVHLLRWLLARFYAPVMALLAGFMAGSLAKLWPWRVPLEAGALRERNLLPATYAAETGQPAHLAAAALALLAGALVVWLLSRQGPVHNGGMTGTGKPVD